MRDLRSELDSVPGIGPRRRKALLDRIRQSGRRAPRLSRGADGGRRRENGGRRACDFSPDEGDGNLGYTLYPFCPTSTFTQISSSSLSCVLLFSLTVHEAAHAWSASRLGDDTAKRLGRVSLNPIVHTDPIGTLLLPLVALASGSALIIGWAKPMPVNPRNLGHPRRDNMLVAAAGPASNLVIAVAASRAYSSRARDSCARSRSRR